MTLEKIKGIAGTVSAVAAVVILSWGVVTQAGWIISRADAANMISVAVQMVSTQAAQSVLDEAKARERADLQFQKSLLTDKITALLNLPKRSGAQDYELEQLKADVKRISDRLDLLQ